VNHFLFLKHDHTYIIIVLMYVDDIIIIGNNQEQIKEIKTQLKRKYDIQGFSASKIFFRYRDSIFTKGSISFTRKIYIRLIKRNKNY
jgi:Reverse transcriptase (RNA-dependent DNA polymerase)